jgi:cell division protein FtsI/penicillin-binding protein 2
VLAIVIVYRLVSFQILRDEELAEIGRNVHFQNIVARPDRGIIYDRNMAVLAGNGNDYQVGVSPSLITNAQEMATSLAPILQEQRRDLLHKLTSDYPFELLAGRISPDAAEAIRSLPYQDDIQLDPLPRRITPKVI